MGFIYGLLVVLVIFEGIIIQCAGVEDKTSLNCDQDPLTNDIKRELPFLPNDLIEMIISKTDFKTIHEAVRSYYVPATNLLMSRILQDHIIVIDRRTRFDVSDIHEIHVHGNSYLRFCNYEKLVQFFDRFGHLVKKIEIWYSSLSSEIPHKAINQNIIKRCAKHLEDLRFGVKGDLGFWEEISDGENNFTFPEVKKFQNAGCTTPNKFKLSSIFPKLESLKLDGPVADVNCLANVKGLKELILVSSSIEEHKLDDIFTNNVNMTKIYLFMPEKRETTRSIAKYLTKLETLGVEFPGENFWLRANNSEVYTLPSVEHVDIEFHEKDEVFSIGNLSFDMPNLKKLTLTGRRINGQIINFINHYKKLEIVELFVTEHVALEYIEKLQHIKEITTTYYEHDFDSLKNLFERLNEKSKLQTWKFAYFSESEYKFYESEMEEINVHLKKSMKSTWTLSHGEQFGGDKRNLILNRDPFTSCKE